MSTETTKENITFSIIIPAYNCEKSLEESVSSVLCQLGPDDEIIIVDDCSTDRTLSVAERMGEDERRIKLVRLPANQGRAEARKRGALESTGDKVMFLDADDSYRPGLLATLRRTLTERDYDIVHFGIEMRVFMDDESSYVDKDLSRWFSAYDGELYGNDVFEGCFTQHRYQWNLVNKCFNGQILKRACCFTPSYSIQRGEDAFLYFVVAYFAKSYLGLPRDMYVYNFGAGADSARKMTIDEFSQMCESARAVQAIREFLDGQECHDGVYRHGLDEMKRILADGVSTKIRTQISAEDTYSAVRKFMESWGEPASIASLSRTYGNDLESLSVPLEYPKPRQLRPGDTIASFYWCFTGGGAENVQRMLVKVWQSMGLNVVLLMEHEPDADEIAKLGVEWHLLPAVPDYGDCEERIAALGAIVDELDIKGIVYHQWLYQQLFWDQMLFRMRGLPFYIHCHGIFVHCMEYDSPKFSSMPYSYRHANGIVSLSETDAMWWHLFNQRTFVTVNPSLYKSTEAAAKNVPDGRRILWLGRVAPEKRPFEALEVFRMVLREVPDARLDFVGGAVDPNYEKSVRDRAVELGIDHAVNFTGWSNEQEQYYRQARVFLMTSAPTEGYPLTLGECQAFGIPCVMYDLPYLTLVRQSKGIRTVKPMSRRDAAEELARILTDDAEYGRAREGALEMAREVESFDFPALWRKVLFTEETPDEDLLGYENLRIVARMILVANQMGHDMRAEQVASLTTNLERCQRDLDAIRQELSDVRNSVSFKVGRGVTAAPRKARDMMREVIRR